MSETRYQWDNGNLDHIADHDIEDFEAEEALEDPRGVTLGAYNKGDEKRYGILGATEAGRILAVFYTFRGSKVRVATARDAKPNEKRRYRKRK